ncbi:beta-glucosidase-like glycosyl hydrolase [Clostridium beijerinckii]|uniref:hypothetical protein n=1 Tax=Clostridium beijerinckii TaxID=1520 RepID=UPI0017C2313F|nr:beta-glucosidase-like glycosyl hydrolase [Clostridium beijerinckii]
MRTLLAFEDAYSNEYDESVIGCEDHIKLALQAAREGITLIKNENNVLPLSKDKAKKNCCVRKVRR